jgi:MFS family permease
MSHKQRWLLLACNFLRHFIGTLMVSLLPVYATQLGADASGIGVYFAVAYIALTLGTFFGGWLSKRFFHRRNFIAAAALLNAPFAVLIGVSTTMQHLVIATVINWFLIGIMYALLTILMGMYANADERGRVFGFVGVGQGLAQISAGLTGGAVVLHWGYAGLFVFAAGLEVVLCVVALQLEDRKKAPGKQTTITSEILITAMYRTVNPSATWLIMGASVLANIVLYSSLLGRPLAMTALGYNEQVISSAVAFAGLISIPLPFLMGGLSDKFGRRGLLSFCYGVMGLGAVLMAVSTDVSHFQFTAILMAFINAAMPLGTALVMDITPKAALSQNASRYNATPWIGGIAGCVVTGVVMNLVGIQITFLAISGLAVGAIALLYFVPISTPQVKSIDPRSTAEIRASA